MESENKKTYYRDKFGKFTTKRKLEIEHKRVENILKKKVDGDDSSLRLLNLEGRRIIDLRLLAEKLWCTFCNDALSLRFLVKEEFLGLVLSKRKNCYWFVLLKYSNQYRIRVNYRFYLGLLASGMGVSQLNTILASLNVPTLYHTLFKRYEREVGVMIEKVAHDSCQKNLQIEKAMTLQKKRYSNMYNNCLNLILMTYFVE
ncbi:uncharacterized protein LOC123261733 isoform X2 [Cotesia glomerata]|uniref:uncharacterized protein LOC123261733 isoform X2 n=1 Tax=Cotesia glomerata TaxID=32391 RepID=UPI001D024805|nr:uncharacterized protein LOC123261733 isoform X2 [Cotesia glomerata]